MGEEQRTEQTEYWLQRWIAIAQTIGISKSELMENYYYDEFIAVMDAYNDMHTLEKDKKESVYADEFD